MRWTRSSSTWTSSESASERLTSSLTASATYPGTGFVLGVAINPNDPQEAVVVDRTAVFRTTDAGATWTRSALETSAVSALSIYASPAGSLMRQRYRISRPGPSDRRLVYPRPAMEHEVWTVPLRLRYPFDPLGLMQM